MDLADLSMNQIVEPTSDIVENKEVELKEELEVKVEMNVEMKETVKEEVEDDDLVYTEEEKAYNKLDDVMFNKKCLNSDIKRNVKLEEEEVVKEEVKEEVKAKSNMISKFTCCGENNICNKTECSEDADVTTQMLEKKETEKEVIDLTNGDEDEEGVSQDTKQQVNTALALVLELYRAVMGCLLVIFVPQNCNGVSCSVSDNINNAGGGLSMVGLIFNLLTLASLSGMYYYETRREFKMISYLESNSYKARDADSVEEALTKLSPHRKERLLKLNVNYGRLGYASLGLFGINSAISGIVVFNNFLDAKTLTVFLTNVLFMSSKLGNVYEIIHTEPNIFYSAFLTRKIQYNDVDPDKVEEIKLEV